MKTLSLLLVAATLLLAAQNCNADAKIEEQELGPAGQWLACAISPHGLHTAVLAMKGSRYVVIIDGVEGPKIDGMLDLSGSPYLIGNAELSSSDEIRVTPVVFSDDGAHCAYYAKVGSEYVVMLDGKELSRGKWGSSTLGYLPLQFSAGGKHLFYVETDETVGGLRLVADGKRELLLQEPPQLVLSPEGSRYAYVAAKRGEEKRTLFVDGKDAGYVGEQPQFTADGQHLFCTGPQQGAVVGLLVDGKLKMKTDGISKLYMAPVGNGFAAALQSRNPSGQFLIVNGKKIGGSECQLVEQVFFSPDAKRCAALCRTDGGTEFMIIDGKKGQEYPHIDTSGNTAADSDHARRAWANPGQQMALDSRLPAVPGFTPDSSKFVYVASAPPRNFLVVEGEESDAYPNFLCPVFGGGGKHIGFIAGGQSETKQTLVIDGKDRVFTGREGSPAGVWGLSFSPDGAHYAFVCGSALYLDGVEQPGVTGGVYLFSPDSKHIAMLGASPAHPTQSLFIDCKLAAGNLLNARLDRPMFTPDSQHLLWIGSRRAETSTDHDYSLLFVDGKPTIHFINNALVMTAGNWEMSANGVLTFVARTGDAIKRFRVTPSPDTSLATLLADVDVAAKAEDDKTAAGKTRRNGRNQQVTPIAPEKSDKAKPRADVTPAKEKLAVMLAKAETGAEATAEKLTWQELVSRPELWPAQCTIKQTLKFEGGASVQAGQKVNVLELKASEVDARTEDGRMNFVAQPDDTDALAVANEAYAKLTPKQLELTYASLIQRKNLWPYRVTMTTTLNFGGGKTLTKGDKVVLMDIEPSKLRVLAEKLNITFPVAPQATDLMAQARKFAEDKQGAAGRVIGELEGKLVNSVTGRPEPLDDNILPRYIVFYRGSTTCSITRNFTPMLVRYYNNIKPKHPEFEVVYLTIDSVADTEKFAKEMGFSWRAVTYENTTMPSVSPYIDGRVPQFIVMDRAGKVLANGLQATAPAALKQLDALLKKPAGLN